MSDARWLKREEVGSLKGRETESRALQYGHSCRGDSGHLSWPEWERRAQCAAKGLWLKFYLSVKGAGASPGCGGGPGGPSVWSRKTLTPKEGPWGRTFPGAGIPPGVPGQQGKGSASHGGPGKACSRH